MKFYDEYIDRIEHDLTVDMEAAITIPAGPRLEGIAIYVAASPFAFAYGPDRIKTLKATAHLVAAAPELLEALVALLQLQVARDNNPAFAAAHSKARRAIAKAEGE